MNWKKCRSCGCEMVGIRDDPESCRDHCHGCDGESLIEQSPQRLDARRTLAEIYNSMRNPPKQGGDYVE